MTDDVVITGLGAITPLGGDVASTWEAVLAGRSGITAIAEPWAADIAVRIAGRMAVDPSASLPKAQARRMDRSQHAALAAFAPDTLEILEARRHAFAKRRNALLPALRQIGFRFATEPQGAFYLYADISGLADSSETLAKRLIEEAGVATTPGLDFGDNAPEQHLRIAYTTDEARLKEAAERIGRVLNQH